MIQAFPGPPQRVWVHQSKSGFDLPTGRCVSPWDALPLLWVGGGC